MIFFIIKNLTISQFWTTMVNLTMGTFSQLPILNRTGGKTKLSRDKSIIALIYLRLKEENLDLVFQSRGRGRGRGSALVCIKQDSTCVNMTRVAEDLIKHFFYQ